MEMEEITIQELNIEESINGENSTDTDTDYSVLLQEIIDNQAVIISQTETLTVINNNLNVVNENMFNGLLHIFYINGMLFIIAILAIVSRYILKIF